MRESNLWALLIVGTLSYACAPGTGNSDSDETSSAKPKPNAPREVRSDTVRIEKQFFDDDGARVATEEHEYPLTSEPQLFIDGRPADEPRVEAPSSPVVDLRREKGALKRFIVQL